MQATGAGLAGQREAVEAGVVGAEHGGTGRHDPCRVERADQGEEAALGVGEGLHAAGRVGRRGELRAKAVPLVPSETTTSPGRSPRPSAAPMLSPVPAATASPDAVWPDDLGRRRDARHGQVAADGEPEQVGAVVAGARGPVARAGGVAAVGRPRLESGAVG